jgi:hypothetical protein
LTVPLMFNLLPKDAKFYDELEQLSDRVVSEGPVFSIPIRKLVLGVFWFQPDRG